MGRQEATASWGPCQQEGTDEPHPQETVGWRHRSRLRRATLPMSAHSEGPMNTRS